MENEKIIFCGNDSDFLREDLIKNSNESNGGTAFRIPSLIKSGDNLIAAIDKQSSGMDWGFIELAYRLSKDNGETWSNIKIIATPPARETIASAESYSSAFFIDPCMARCPNGDLILIIDFYPECKGLHNRRILDKNKKPYTLYNRQLKPTLYDRDGNFYIIDSDGKVLDHKFKLTDYKVTDWQGSLYKNDEYVGNIYLNGKTGRNEMNTTITFGAPLKRPKRNYIFLFRSTDNGETWQDPIDITQDILIDDDGTFIGVAPGVGITTKDDKIIFPLYVDKKEAVSIFSVDNGYSWHRMKHDPYAHNIDEWQMIQADDETIFGFGRSKKFGKTPFNMSKDKGKTWQKLKPTSIKAPKCQKSVVSVGNYVFCVHPSKKTRSCGVISVGKYIELNNKVYGIEWLKDVKINDDFFAYSSVEQLDEDTIGVLYEAQPSSYILFKKFKISELIK